MLALPIERNIFDLFADTAAANEAALTAIGVACQSVAQPACPVRTGNLRRSHTFKVDGDHVDIGVTADYGGHVHNGTAKNKKGNPWLKDAAQANRDSILAAGKRAWEQVLGR